MDRGIDASVELSVELDRLGESHPLALQAPRDRSLYKFLAMGMDHPQTETRASYTALTETLIERLGIWWSPSTYQRMPVLTPWCIRDRSARYDQGPESWGAPRADGYLRDDNSIIKKLPLSVTVEAPEGHPYAGRRPWRGFTACHVWGTDVDGHPSGADPWLYSFVPNLVWLPTAIAPLSDRQGSRVQMMLMQTALYLYAAAPMRPLIEEYSKYAWSRLPAPLPEFGALRADHLAQFTPDAAFYRRRIAYLDQFISGASSVLTTGQLTRKVICTRYTTGFPALDREHIAAFRSALSDYRDALVGEPDPVPH